MPKQWKKSKIILIPKKGSYSNREKFRPISICSTVRKLFTRILKECLLSKLDFEIGCDQAGFRKGYSVTDHLHTLNQVIEKVKEYKLSLYLLFIDFQGRGGF